MILMTLGVSGLLIELYHPGLILPGVVGLVCLVTAFYALQALSASMAGVTLMLAGLVFLVLELHVVSYGLLAAAGIGSILLGAAMMFRAGTGLAISWKVLAGAVGGFVAVFGALAVVVARVMARKPRAGTEAMVGRTVVSTGPLSPKGSVTYGGERWRAESVDGPHPAGAELEVVEVKDLTLRVRTRA
jgi:membrane-bound serine protease (ClpP class)